jgi:hypothetical protein
VRSPLVSLKATLRTNNHANTLFLSAFCGQKDFVILCDVLRALGGKIFLVGILFYLAKLSVLKLEGTPPEDSVLNFLAISPLGSDKKS